MTPQGWPTIRRKHRVPTHVGVGGAGHLRSSALLKCSGALRQIDDFHEVAPKGDLQRLATKSVALPHACTAATAIALLSFFRLRRVYDRRRKLRHEGARGALRNGGGLEESCCWRETFRRWPPRRHSRPRENEGSRESKGPLCSSARTPRLDAEAKKRHRIASRMTLTVSSGWSHRGKWPLCSNQWIAAPGKAAMARFA